MKRKCSWCHNNPGVWPVHSGGKICDGCKGTVERCESQRGTGGEPKVVHGCFSKPIRTK
jgi:hypothetical protein